MKPDDSLQQTKRSQSGLETIQILCERPLRDVSIGMVM